MQTTCPAVGWIAEPGQASMSSKYHELARSTTSYAYRKVALRRSTKTEHAGMKSARQRCLQGDAGALSAMILSLSLLSLLPHNVRPQLTSAAGDGVRRQQVHCPASCGPRPRAAEPRHESMRPYPDPGPECDYMRTWVFYYSKDPAHSVEAAASVRKHPPP